MELSFLVEEATRFLAIFARLGTIMMLLPALGETTIPPRIRLSLALTISLIFLPLTAALYPPTSGQENLHQFGLLFMGEFAIGFFVGLGIRLVTYSLQIAGVIIANQSGLAMAMATDPSNPSQQGALIGAFLSVLAVTLIFTTDTHFLLIAAIHDSFQIFPPGRLLPVSDVAAYIVKTLSNLMSISMRISAPFLIIGIVFYFGLGLLNRLMPQMQIFFIAMPVSISLGTGLLMLLIATMMSWYMGQFTQSVGMFTIAGDR